MWLLACDTATGGCSVAVMQEGRVRAVRAEEGRGIQARMLVPMMQQAIQEAGTTSDDLDYFAVTIGPGGFTGVRIALAAVKGMALALKTPVVPVSTLELYAYAAAGSQNHTSFHVRLPAGRGYEYAQSFECTPLPGEAWEIAGLDAPEVVPAGSGEGDGAPSVTPESCARAPTAADLAGLAWARLRRDTACALPGAEVQPLYLRPPDAKLPQV